MQIRLLSPILQGVAYSELNEDAARLQDDIKHIQEWASKQSHFHVVPEPQLIVAFLRGCKFSLEKAKKKLETYYTIRSVCLEVFSTRDPFSLEIQEIFKRKIVVKLPNGSDASAPVRYLARVGNADPDKVSLITITKFLLMAADIELQINDSYVVNGQEGIVDLQDLPYSYIGQITPKLLKMDVLLLQEAYPLRLKGLYLINIPPFMEVVINTFKSLLSKKLGSRVHCFPANDFESLYKIVPQSVFPEEYGGDAGPMEKLSIKRLLFYLMMASEILPKRRLYNGVKSIRSTSNTRERTLKEQLLTELETNNEWLKKSSEYRSDENKRIGKPAIIDEFNSVEGSFRKLDVD